MYKVYGAYRNSDLTEGKGRLILIKVFESRTMAELFINDQPGIMGRRAKWTEGKCQDWQVKEIEVINDKDVKISFEIHDQAKEND